MDFERSILSSLFCDYSPREVVESLCENRNPKNCQAIFKKSLLNKLPSKLKGRLPYFTYTERERVKDEIEAHWKSCLSASSNILQYLFEIVNQLLTFENGDPCVEFDQLLRWRELSLNVGEDLLVCAFLSLKEPDEISYLWPDIIGHNGEDVNRILQGALYDLHSHAASSVDVFTLSWIRQMNVADNVELNLSEEDRTLLLIARKLRSLLFCFISTEEDILITDVIKTLSWLYHPSNLQNEIDLLNGFISNLKMKVLGSYEAKSLIYWDYALNVNTFSEKEIACPYILLAGERNLLFECFRQFNKKSPNKKKDAISITLYLYYVIKLNFRQRILLVKDVLGLKEFQQVQKKKGLLGGVGDNSISYQYLIETSLGVPNPKHFLELRINMEEVTSFQTMQFKQSLLLTRPKLENESVEHVKFVLCIGKPGDSVRKDQTNKLEEWGIDQKRQLDNTILHIKESVPGYVQKCSPIVGVDFGGSDTKARPYVFARIVRYLRSKGVRNFTYHVGEEFYDIIDGLRAVEEVLFHLCWDSNCRMSHLLVLTMPVDAYYRNRKYNVVMPRQMLLDNITWLLVKGLNDTADKLRKKAEDLYAKIGYKGTYQPKIYYNSMLLRGEGSSNSPLEDGRQLNLYESAMHDSRLCIRNLWKDEEVVKLFRQYREDCRVYNNGKKVDMWHFEYDPAIEEFIKKQQNAICKRVYRKHIAIETCPSSNYKIGYFDRYIDLPFFDFIKSESKASVSVNTDIRGALPTSIENEFSLLAIAMKKEGKSQKEIRKALLKARRNGKQRYFYNPPEESDNFAKAKNK